MSENTKQFQGFYVPNSTQVPDTLFDELLPELSGAELKVVLYIIRRTFGFKRQSDTISLSQLLQGIRKKNGEVLDRGTGLAKPTLLRALRNLTERAIILPTRHFDQKGGYTATEYHLHIAPSSPPQAQAASNEMLPRGLGNKMIPGEAQNVTKPLVTKNYPQGTGLQDTENTVNVNGSANAQDSPHAERREPDRTDLRRLPDLAQEREETQSVADFILSQLGDEHSQAFYYLVAAKVPAHIVHRALSEIRHDGARSPARVFVHRMKQYAADALAAPRHPDIRSELTELGRRKAVGSHSEDWHA